MPDDLLNRREGAQNTWQSPDYAPDRNVGRRGAPLLLVLLMGLAGFAAGGGAVGWMVLHGDGHAGSGTWRHLLPPTVAPTPSAPLAPEALPNTLIASQTTLDARIVAAEQRLDRLDMQAAAAAGNAARAEGLLVAFAARRVIERGASLGYLEDQLKLRFGDAQPRAVATLITTARNPVTLDQLTARLQMMAGHISEAPSSETLWDRTRHQLSSMLTIHRDIASGPTPTARLDHALAALREGAIDTAITDVQRLPPTRETTAWMADARRYAEAQAALDRIETAALLEPHTLGDGTGRRVTQPSPLVPPQLASPETPAPSGR